MARGWESKDVEEQQSLLHSGLGKRQPKGSSSNDRERTNRREVLLMDRARLTNELNNVRNERFRLQLCAELSYVDRQLAQLNGEA